jgi:hypothetical protein
MERVLLEWNQRCRSTGVAARGVGAAAEGASGRLDSKNDAVRIIEAARRLLERECTARAGGASVK